MRKILFSYFFLFLFFMQGVKAASVCCPERILYTSQDSLLVEQYLKEASLLPINENRVLFFAKKFLDIPYVVSTLEVGEEEQLIINLRELDCTTFVENVLALCLAERSSSPNFQSFVSALCSLRYRGGLLNGYPSRLHYFSDWIEDNIRMGMIHEVKVEDLPYSKVQVLSTNYMSKHPEKYKQLAQDSINLAQIVKQEQQLIGKQVYYLPKHVLNGDSLTLPICNGDILVLTTNIDGLDISHVGFAVWMEDGALHLFHASMRSKKVIIDKQTLYHYSRGIKSQTGVRIIRLKRGN